MIEQLTPTERAVFVLREAFDFDHKEIAESISITPANSRQILKRTKEKIANPKHITVSDQRSMETAKQFVQFISEGKLEELIALFNDEISIIGDGGGKVPAIKQPVYGKENVAQFLLHIFGNKHFMPSFQFIEILSQPSIIVNHHDECVFVQILSLSKDKI